MTYFNHFFTFCIRHRVGFVFFHSHKQSVTTVSLYCVREGQELRLNPYSKPRQKGGWSCASSEPLGGALSEGRGGQWLETGGERRERERERERGVRGERR